MPYIVTSPLVLVRVPGVGDSYRLDYHYQGDIVPWLSDEQEKHFLDEGLVEKVGGRKSKAPKADAEPEGAGDPGADPEPPPHAAVKDAWVEFVVAKTANTDKPVTAEEAEALTKAELIELYG